MKTENKIHIGTSGWSYKHWTGSFYPENTRPTDFLRRYAEHFAVTEINGSFYKLPQKKTILKWARTTPEGFLFCPKISRYLSHMKKLHDPEEPLQRFFDIFDPVQERLGPVLIQVPAKLSFNEEVVTHLYEVLGKVYSAYNFAIEVRHDSWFSMKSIRLMKQHNIALVLAQSDIYPSQEYITSSEIYIRFHGPGELYSSPYPDETLRKYADKFIRWSENGHRVWAFFNNDVGGYAPHNAETLRRMVQER